MREGEVDGEVSSGFGEFDKMPGEISFDGR